jgi:hypothetical protein
MKKINQKQLVIQWLNRWGSIEPMEAFMELGIYRLGARIKDLRDEGIAIKTELESGISKKTGRVFHYARYIIDNG